MEILHNTAFTTTSSGGNPAGVVLDASAVETTAMAAIATRLGYSESVFLTPRTDGGYSVRYFPLPGRFLFAAMAPSRPLGPWPAGSGLARCASTRPWGRFP